MTDALGDVPADLRAAAEGAVRWLNDRDGTSYEVTGVVDDEPAPAAGPGGSYELGLVLCDGEICAREQVRVQPTEGGFDFSAGNVGRRDIPPLLDPPEGLRRAWLEGALQKHEFVLLLFYRGLW